MTHSRSLRAAALRSVVCAAILAAIGSGAVARASELTELSLEDLMNVEVTLPSRRPEPRVSASAAIYVITQEDIRRSGVTNIPDALRLAPGVQVARATASQWAIGIRGFASRLARSVLVLMDGRSVYDPLFAGTYWEVQDTVLEDIERIEVIRGPGGALWGANAFNGVINIVTKNAKDTQGAYVEAGGGTEERGFGTVRYGAKLGQNLYYRAYAKYFYRSAFFNPDGDDFDAWQMGRSGFRMDWEPQDTDQLTLQGDYYDGRIGESVGIARYEPPFFFIAQDDAHVSGADVLGRWNHTLSPTSDIVAQMYYDYNYRREPNFTEQRNTVDIEAQHRFALPWRQEILWGLGYRVSVDDTGGVPTVEFIPRSKTLNLVSSFIQDNIWLIPDQLRLTAGTKIDYYTYSGVNLQPSGSLLWTPLPGHTVWGSISRAIREPSRIERDLLLTARPVNAQPPANDVCLPAGSPCLYPRVTRNPDFKPEEIVAYQIGYRIQPLAQIFVDVASFYNQFDDLLSLEAGAPFPEEQPPLPHVVAPLVFKNGLHGESYGVEVTLTSFVTSWWRLSGSYSYLTIHLKNDLGVNDIGQVQTEDASPTNQVSVQSMLDGPWGVQLDSVFRYVDTIKTGGQVIPSYVTFDVRAARSLTHNLELALVGQNLWQPHHREFAPGTEVPRGMYGQVTWRW